MSIKQYQFFCTNCCYKKFVPGNEIAEFVQVKQSDIERGIPVLDQESKTVSKPPPIKRKKVFKCPKCGFVIRPKELKEDKNESTNRTNGSETSSEGPPIS